MLAVLLIQFDQEPFYKKYIMFFLFKKSGGDNTINVFVYAPIISYLFARLVLFLTNAIHESLKCDDYDILVGNKKYSFISFIFYNYVSVY